MLEDSPTDLIEYLSGSSFIVVAAGGRRGNSPDCRLTGYTERFTAKIEHMRQATRARVAPRELPQGSYCTSCPLPKFPL